MRICGRVHSLVEVALREGFEEVASMITEYFRFYDYYAFYVGFDYFH